MKSNRISWIRKSISCRLFLVFATILAGSQFSLPYEATDGLREAKLGWANYRKSAATIQGECDETFLNPDRQVKSKAAFSFCQSGGSFSYLWQPLGEKGKRARGRLRVQNPEYGFELSRTNEGGPWAVADVSTRIRTDKINKYDSPNAFVVRSTDNAINFAGSSLALPELSNEADFVIRSLSRARATDGCVKLVFEMPAIWLEPRVVDGILVEKGWNGVRKGWVELDPGLMWVVRAYDVEYQGQNGPAYFVAGKNEYVGDHAGPMLSKATMTSRKGAAVSSDVISIWEWNHRWNRIPPTESIFTLSHYGFPEPTPPPTRPRSYLWMAIIGGACVVVAVIMTYRNRSMKNRQNGGIMNGTGKAR